MSADRLLAVLPVAALAAVGVLAAARWVALRRRGVPVVVIDPQRTAGDKLLDLAIVVVGLFWVYLAVDFVNGAGARWAPVWFTRSLFDVAPVKWFGAAMLVAGVALYGRALHDMGDSWRMGIDRAAHATLAPPESPSPAPRAALVERGVFAWSRNPIYLAFDLILIGAIAIHGRVAFQATATALVLLLHVQMLREERFLEACYGKSFHDYRRRVGRYWLWV